ncbi:MAG: hypothetical protein IJF78_14625 [Clostridia bacterium]|nr:hypothetical protein [Clostridia bacterium]
MRIEVFDEGKRVINLIFPTAVLFNSLTAKITAKMIGKAMNGKAEEVDVDLRELTELSRNLPDSAELSALCAEIRRFKRRHPGFVLVETIDTEGDGIKITL